MSQRSSLSDALMAVSECLRRWNGVMAERSQLLQEFQTQLKPCMQPCMQPIRKDSRTR